MWFKNRTTLGAIGVSAKSYRDTQGVEISHSGLPLPTVPVAETPKQVVVEKIITETAPASAQIPIIMQPPVITVNVPQPAQTPKQNIEPSLPDIPWETLSKKEELPWGWIAAGILGLSFIYTLGKKHA